MIWCYQGFSLSLNCYISSSHMSTSMFSGFCALCLEMHCWCVSFLCNEEHFSNLCIISLQLASSAWASSTWINCKILQTLSASRPAVISKFPLSSFPRVTMACRHKMNHYFLNLFVFISLSRNVSFNPPFNCSIRDQVVLQRSVVSTLRVNWWSYQQSL